MKYAEKYDNTERFYSVLYDEDKLKDILEKLKDYNYVTIRHHKVSRSNIIKWPATDKTIKRRVIKYEKNVKPETIVYHTENGCNYVTYDCTYNKLPDLYDYIDIIVNDKSIINYPYLFEKVIEEKTGSLNLYYAAMNQDQLVLEGILNYITSEELTNHSSIYDEKIYDYKGLNELYKEALGCFSFNLIATKEYLTESKNVDVLSLK